MNSLRRDYYIDFVILFPPLLHYSLLPSFFPFFFPLPLVFLFLYFHFFLHPPLSPLLIQYSVPVPLEACMAFPPS